MEEQQRQFKGIWIPKEIWLNKDLTFQEKIILVEIDSYDDGQVGCFATNKHFVNNFGINSSRISQIIQSLQRKNYITITYDFNGKEIIKRYLHINRPPYPPKDGMSKINIGMLKNEMGVCQFDKGGYVKKLKDNNTNINNTNINNKEERKKETNYDKIINSMVEDEEVKNSIYEFIKMRKLIKKPMTDRALTMLINKLYKLSNNKQIQIKILEQSILKNWTDIYPYKEENNYAGYQGNVKTDLSKYDR